MIRLLMQDESLFPPETPLAPEDFSSPLLGRIFAQLWQDRQSGHALGLAQLSSVLTGEEMSHLTTIMQKPESTANAAKALQDYIAVIRQEKEKRDGSAGIDPLAAAGNKFKETKGYGGKRHE